jgi:hypothetical protein
MMSWLLSNNENHVIAVRKLFSSMGEFRMCFKTYAIKSLMPRLTGLIKINFMLDAEVLMGEPILANGTFPLDSNQMEVPLELIKSLL